MYPSTHIFNQYYFDLLKKIRDKARSRKYDSREARHVLKGMKAHYQSYDKSDDRYRAWFASTWAPVPNPTEPTESDATPEVKQEDNAKEKEKEKEPEFLYEDVKLADVRAFYDKSIVEHFISILKIFMSKDLSNSDTMNAVKALRLLKNNKKPEYDALADAVSDELVREQLKAIFAKNAEHKAFEANDALKRIENTSLGKLAKDIMAEVNVEEIQKSMEDGDILASLSNPDSGLTKVLSTVSAKMLAKLASGELQQETLLQDAMKLAGDLGMGGNKRGGGAGGLGGLGGLADMGEMIKTMQSMGLGGGGDRGGSRGVPTGGKRPHVRPTGRKMKPKVPKPAEE